MSSNFKTTTATLITKIQNNGVVIVGVVDRDVTAVFVPAKIGGRKVVAFGDYAFADCSRLESIIFEKGVALTELGKSAFDGCASLKEFNAPVVQTAAPCAFYGCRSLESVNFSAGGLRWLGDHAFDGCARLKTALFSSGVQGIGNFAFSRCRDLRALQFHAGLRYIGCSAFWGVHGLESFTAPMSLASLDGTGLGLGRKHEEPNKLTLFGAPGSALEIYARKHGFNFKAV